ncbi:YdcF family protein [bacterium]|nr:YdcF family protein [bacterium]
MQTEPADIFHDREALMWRVARKAIVSISWWISRLGYNCQMQRFLRIMSKFVVLLALCTLFVMIAIPPFLYFYFRQKIYVSIDSVIDSPQTVMVLGAAVYSNDTPSGALQERLNTAAELYEKKNVVKILVSGARSSEYYDEPRTMRAELVKLGVPDEAILEDNLGLRTFDSCRRAKSEFGISSLLVVSQGFHLPRALFLCDSVGIETTGIYATGNFSSYHGNWYNFREVAAMYLAVWDITRFWLE